MFEKALEFTLRWEGGYSNDPKDPGGETNYGISKRAYPNEDIKNLTKERAGELYKRDYWDVFNCDSRLFPDACAIFDTCVNCGVARTAIWLDGSKTWEDLLKYRRGHYETLVKKNKKFSRFLKGWMNRLDALIVYIRKNEPHTKQ